MTNERLPRELVWDGAHVSELGLTAMADGQESILGDGAVEHVEVCEQCAGRMGRIALTSSAVGEALVLARAAVAGTTDARSARAATAVQRPWSALALGVAVAVLAAVPTLHDVLHAPAFATTFAAHGVKALVHVGLALATSSAVARGLPPATLAASALLVVMGWVIARWVSRETAVASEGSRS
jgi:hypothetical protein